MYIWKVNLLLRTSIARTNGFEGGHTPEPYSGNYEDIRWKLL